MLTKEQFIKAIELVQQFNKSLDSLYEEKIDFTNSTLFTSFSELSDLFWISHFTTDGVDWINWWLYERVDIISGEILAAFDEDDNEIDVSSPDKLWDLVVEYLIK